MRLELRGITKVFGSLVANDHIDLVVEPGQIHSLLGENGAGKSTLMNVLYGLYQPDGGQILVDGEPRRFDGPGDAMAAGIGMVHQHFMLVPVFTVAENVMLGHEQTRAAGVLDLDAARRQVREISERFGFSIDPDALVEDLPIGAQQRVEIIKALSRRAEVLILDEPTAVLTPQETDELMGIIRQLAEAGTSIVFITHKLREVRAVADAITVIRRGRVVGTAEPSADESELATLMVGRPVVLEVEKAPAEPGAPVLEIAGLSVLEDDGTVSVDDVDLTVREGEIVALAGVQGNGQTELTEALMGLKKNVTGRATVAGKDVIRATTKSAYDHGVGFVPEDRTHDGLVGAFTVAENLVLDRYDRAPYGSALTLKVGTVAETAQRLVDEFDIRTSSIHHPVTTLSGGNQQKVVMARALNRDLKLLVASQPTRGVDVGSIEFLHKRIVAARDEGVPVLIVSTELDEIESLADRIAVMYRGRVIGVVPGDTDRDVLGLMMAGYTHDDAVAAAAAAGTSAAADRPEDQEEAR